MSCWLMTSLGYELIVISACVLGGIPERRPRKSLICGGERTDIRNGGECDEPAQHFTFCTVRGSRLNPSGSSYLRPL